MLLKFIVKVALSQWMFVVLGQIFDIQTKKQVNSKYMDGLLAYLPIDLFYLRRESTSARSVARTKYAL